MKIIERTTQDMENETVQLFKSIKPLLEEGKSLCTALQEVKGIKGINSTRTWYKNLKKYIASQGYELPSQTGGRKRL